LPWIALWRAGFGPVLNEGDLAIVETSFANEWRIQVIR